MIRPKSLNSDKGLLPLSRIPLNIVKEICKTVTEWLQPYSPRRDFLLKWIFLMSLLVENGWNQVLCLSNLEAKEGGKR